MRRKVRAPFAKTACVGGLSVWHDHCYLSNRQRGTRESSSTAEPGRSNPRTTAAWGRSSTAAPGHATGSSTAGSEEPQQYRGSATWAAVSPMGGRRQQYRRSPTGRQQVRRPSLRQQYRRRSRANAVSGAWHGAWQPYRRAEQAAVPPAAGSRVSRLLGERQQCRRPPVGTQYVPPNDETRRVDSSRRVREDNRDRPERGGLAKPACWHASAARDGPGGSARSSQCAARSRAPSLTLTQDPAPACKGCKTRDTAGSSPPGGFPALSLFPA
jgi:hypothetical protein